MGAVHAERSPNGSTTRRTDVTAHLLPRDVSREDHQVFVWVFHRVSGVLLIVLLSLQLFTGFFQASTSNSDAVATIAGLHKHAVVNCLMVFLFIFHSLYGIRTILMDLGLGREKLLFWSLSALGLVIFVVFLVLYATLVMA
jgi:succinate dehydrogenase cytochrome b556 subunit